MFKSYMIEINSAFQFKVLRAGEKEKMLTIWLTLQLRFWPQDDRPQLYSHGLQITKVKSPNTLKMSDASGEDTEPTDF